MAAKAPMPPGVTPDTSDTWTRHTPYHWSQMIGPNQLDYWPTTKKWRFKGKTRTDDVFEFLKLLPPPTPPKAEAAPDSPACAECDGRGSLTTGEEIYPDLKGFRKLFFYQCACGAYVGTHKGTKKALGTCAGPETRSARKRAHAAFDPLWAAVVEKGFSKSVSRNHAYAWLAEKLGYDTGKCHISWMVIAEADRVTELCSATAAISLPSVETDGPATILAPASPG